MDPFDAAGDKLRLRVVLVAAHHVARCPAYACGTVASVLTPAEDNTLLWTEPKCPRCGEELDPDIYTLHAVIRLEENQEMTTQLQEELIAQVLGKILDTEGGFVNNPVDKGGPTNHGITLFTLGNYLKRRAAIVDLKAVTLEDARRILRTLFVERPGFLAIMNPFLFFLVVDAGVNHGPERPIRWLQEAVGASPDGVLGPDTLSRFKGADLGRISRRVLASRIRFYGQIIANDHSQAVFAAGWGDRVADFVERLP